MQLFGFKQLAVVRPRWLLVVLVLPGFLAAQEEVKGRRPLDHAAYARWRSIPRWTVSPRGRWLACRIEPARGTGELLVRRSDGERAFSFPRGRRAAFSWDGRFLLFQIEPARTKGEGTARPSPPGRRRGRRGIPPARSTDRPRPTLALFDLQRERLEKIERIKRFSLPARGPQVLVYQLYRKKPEAVRRGAGKPAERTGAKARTKGRPQKPVGESLYLRDLAGSGREEIERVTRHGLSSRHGRLWYVVGGRGGKDAPAPGLYLRDLATGGTRRLLDGEGTLHRLVFSHDEKRIAFLYTAKKKKEPALWWWRQGLAGAARLLDPGSGELPPDRVLSPASSLRFSRDGSVLAFTLPRKARPSPPLKATSERVTLDLWHYRDGLIQPRQARMGGRLDQDPLSAVIHLAGRGLVVLGDEELPRFRLIDPAGRLAVASTDRPYRQLATWDDTYYDHWLVDTRTGGRRRVAKKCPGNLMNSPDGKYLIHYDSDRHWHAVDTATLTEVNLTAELPWPIYPVDDDRPHLPSPYGLGGWTKGDREVLIYDRYDIWLVAADGSYRRCLTEGWGRAHHLVLRRHRLPAAEEKRWVTGEEPLFLTGVCQESYASGFFRDRLVGTGRPETLLFWDKATSAPRRGLRGGPLFFTASTFREYPDILAAPPDLSSVRRLTLANPQQEEYRWGTAELVHWRSADGIPLKGILYKPDDFDTRRRYPMLVYFYEKRSQRLHAYRTPEPRTTPIASFYVSRGYLYFVPDVVYRPGYPGASCLKCVVPGVLGLVAKGFVDPGAVGVAGHSWGGYQAAWLVTQTDIFRCAEAGAPVSNMFSAYGGIRWGSGRSRQWQYERDQSRIGGSPWRWPLRYLENSPLFFADKVNTPLLMIHNDKDGAVPWYQGIELFMALRRLGKPAWLFNYNGAGHGLRRWPVKMDWTRRMQQFFDHYLKGAPAPEWLEKGVPFRERERINRQKAL